MYQKSDTAPALRPLEFARWIWRQLTSMRTALILLFLLAVAAIPGSLIPQTRVNAVEVQAFRDRHEKLSPFFDKIGMFHVYSSVWFGSIYLLLMISLIGCFVPRLRVYFAAARARPPKAPRNLDRLAAYATWESSDPPEVEADRIATLLRTQRRRVDLVAGDGEYAVSAEKGYLREAGNLLFHFAVLVVLVGVAITGLYGFKGSVLVIQGKGFANTVRQYDDFTPGARFDPADLAPFSFTVDDFHVTWEQSGPGTGTPLKFDAELTVKDDPDAEPYSYDLRVNHPLNVDGSQVFLVGHGYAPVVTIRDGDGNIARSGPVIFLPQDASLVSYGVIKAPDATPEQLAFEGYFFPTASLCNGTPCSVFPDAKNPTLSLLAYHGDVGVDSGEPQSVYVLDRGGLTAFTTPGGKPRALLLTEGETEKLGDGKASITYDGYQRWVRLQISRQPGKIVPLVGVLAAIAGLLGSLFIRPRRTWARVREVDGRTVVEVAALDRVSGGDPEAHIDSIAKALGPQPHPELESQAEEQK